MELIDLILIFVELKIVLKALSDKDLIDGCDDVLFSFVCCNKRHLVLAVCSMSSVSVSYDSILSFCFDSIDAASKPPGSVSNWDACTCTSGFCSQFPIWTDSSGFLDGKNPGALFPLPVKDNGDWLSFI